MSDGTWNHDFEVGVLTVLGVDTPAAGELVEIPGVVHHWRGAGDLFCVTMVHQLENGEMRFEEAPAGKGQLVEPNEVLDPEQWKVIREVQVEAGEEQTVSLRWAAIASSRAAWNCSASAQLFFWPARKQLRTCAEDIRSERNDSCATSGPGPRNRIHSWEYRPNSPDSEQFVVQCVDY